MGNVNSFLRLGLSAFAVNFFNYTRILITLHTNYVFVCTFFISNISSELFMNLLIEVCTERGMVVILQNGQILFSEKLPIGFTNSKYLLPCIQKGLDFLHISMQEISYITLGVGPGSYTGIRVGAVVAKTLAFARQIPLVGLCTLTGFVPKTDGSFAAIIDAKIGGCYVLVGKKENDQIHYLSVPSLYSLEEAGVLLRNIPLLITPISSQLSAKFLTLFPEAKWQWEEAWPDVCHLNQLAIQKFDNKDYCYGQDMLELLYLRKTQAEIEKFK
jgi:tRNA threonylcarbamoyladenosine biosynthesis protein TsaB